MADDENLDANMEMEPEEPKGPFKPMGIDVVRKSLSKLAKTYGIIQNLNISIYY